MKEKKIYMQKYPLRKLKNYHDKARSEEFVVMSGEKVKYKDPNLIAVQDWDCSVE